MTDSVTLISQFVMCEEKNSARNVQTNRYIALCNYKLYIADIYRNMACMRNVLQCISVG
jgi:hypothetical protein